jgi:hypothetical protein
MDRFLDFCRESQVKFVDGFDEARVEDFVK